MQLLLVLMVSINHQEFSMLFIDTQLLNTQVCIHSSVKSYFTNEQSSGVNVNLFTQSLSFTYLSFMV